MEISRNLSKQPFSTGSGRKTRENSLRDYFHLLKSPDFRLLVLECAGSYSRAFTVLLMTYKLKFCLLVKHLSIPSDSILLLKHFRLSKKLSFYMRSVS